MGGEERIVVSAWRAFRPNTTWFDSIGLDSMCLVGKRTTQRALNAPSSQAALPSPLPSPFPSLLMSSEQQPMYLTPPLPFIEYCFLRTVFPALYLYLYRYLCTFPVRFRLASSFGFDHCVNWHMHMLRAPRSYSHSYSPPRPHHTTPPGLTSPTLPVLYCTYIVHIHSVQWHCSNLYSSTDPILFNFFYPLHSILFYSTQSNPSSFFYTIPFIL